MQLDYTVIDPAGNITVLVTTPVAQKERANAAKALLALPALSAEQVGFLCQPRDGGDIRIEMMGGEFCGNALRSAGYYYATEHGGISGIVQAEISGAMGYFPVTVDLARHTASTAIPLPKAILPVSLPSCKQCTAVAFDGILHYVVPSDTPEEVLRHADCFTRAHFPTLGAYGVMFCDPHKPAIRPAVYVYDTDTLYYETSCASGSAATAAALSELLPDGTYRYAISQPGGVLHAEAKKARQTLTGLSIGGKLEIRCKGQLVV